MQSAQDEEDHCQHSQEEAGPSVESSKAVVEQGSGIKGAEPVYTSDQGTYAGLHSGNQSGIAWKKTQR